MRCKECGYEVSSQEVFCPNCGAPLRVTADYDFIQAEIGGKVDLFLNNEELGPLIPITKNQSGRPKAEQKTITLNKSDFNNANSKELTIIGEKPRRSSATEDTIAITKAIYGNDSVFSVNGKISEDGYDDYDDYDSYDDYDDYDNYDGYDDYDDYDDYYDTKSGNNKEGNPDKEYQRIKRRAYERKKKKQKKIILFSILGAVVVAIAVILVVVFGGKKKGEEIDFSDKVTANVEEGATYSAPYEITLWSEKNYRINYTMDGSEPNINSTRYGQPIKITNADIPGDSAQITLKVATYTDSSMPGGTLSVNFTVTKSVISAPVISPESGDYEQAEYINITGPEGVSIYYTYDGSTPSKNSTLYTGPIEMKRGNNIVNAIAIDSSGVQSEVASNVYNLIVYAQISYDDAFDTVMDELVDSGLIESREADESQQYKVPGGGTRRVINGGTCIIGNDSYYVIQVDFTNDGSTVQATTYYGVNDQDGSLSKLNRSGMEYTLA